MNGISSKEIIDNLTQLIHAETMRRKIYSLNKEFHVYYRLAYGNFDRFNLTIRKDNKLKDITVNGINWSKFQNDKKELFVFKQLEKDISYLKIPSFKNTGNVKFSHYIDSVFSELDNNSTNNLIIDVRGGGGLTDYIDTLMGYLTDKPYCHLLEERIKVSSESRDYILSKKDLGEYSKDYFIIKYKKKKPVKQKCLFRGNLYLLIDVRSASCHTLFASIIKCNRLGYLIGEEAGQPLISNGGLANFTLPNTKLICVSAMSTYRMPCAINDFESVTPDFKVTKTVDALLNDKDVILNSAIEIIKNKNQ
jgi:C-terminal processing protease CtpA/Prc